MKFAPTQPGTLFGVNASRSTREPRSNSWLPSVEASTPIEFRMAMSTAPIGMFALAAMVDPVAALSVSGDRQVRAGRKERSGQEVVAARQDQRVGEIVVIGVDQRGKVRRGVRGQQARLAVGEMQQLQGEVLRRGRNVQARDQRIVVAGLVGELRIDADDVELRAVLQAPPLTSRWSSVCALPSNT